MIRAYKRGCQAEGELVSWEGSKGGSLLLSGSWCKMGWGPVIWSAGNWWLMALSYGSGCRAMWVTQQPHMVGPQAMGSWLWWGVLTQSAVAVHDFQEMGALKGWPWVGAPASTFYIRTRPSASSFSFQHAKERGFWFSAVCQAWSFVSAETRYTCGVVCQAGLQFV